MSMKEERVRILAVAFVAALAVLCEGGGGGGWNGVELCDGSVCNGAVAPGTAALFRRLSILSLYASLSVSMLP